MNGLLIIGIALTVTGVALFIYGGGFAGRERDNGIPFFSVPAVFIFALGLTLLLASTDAHQGTVTDPRKGEVWISGHVNKVCDGTTLVYQSSDNVWGIANSPECQPIR